MKNKHLSFDERLNIEKKLMERRTFKEIAISINKNWQLDMWNFMLAFTKTIILLYNVFR